MFERINVGMIFDLSRSLSFEISPNERDRVASPDVRSIAGSEPLRLLAPRDF